MTKSPKQQLRQAEPTENDSSKSIQELSELVKLEHKCIALTQTLDGALKNLEQKDLEIQHLKDLLMGITPQDSKIVTEISDEEMIATFELKRLKGAAQFRELTLDEIRKMDLLVKNKRLAQGDATTIKAENKLNKNTPKATLLELASKPVIKKAEGK